MASRFDRLIERLGTDSIKWGRYDGDVLPMWVADMDFVSPQPVIDALLERVSHGVFGYPMIKKDMKQVIVERMERRYGWSIDPSAVVFVPGVVPGFNLVCQALADSFDLLWIIQLDQNHIAHRFFTIEFRLGLGAYALPREKRHKDGRLQGILLSVADADNV